MLTNNLDFAEWGDAFAANRMVGAATLDRLRHGAYRVILDGESYRTPKALPEGAKIRLQNEKKSAILDDRSRPDFGLSRWRHYAEKTLAPLRRKVTAQLLGRPVD